MNGHSNQWNPTKCMEFAEVVATLAVSDVSSMSFQTTFLVGLGVGLPEALRAALDLAGVVSFELLVVPCFALTCFFSSAVTTRAFCSVCSSVL